MAKGDRTSKEKQGKRDSRERTAEEFDNGLSEEVKRELMQDPPPATLKHASWYLIGG